LNLKVILLSDVKSQGHCGDLIDAKDGYARNYLLRLGLAKEATPRNLAELASQKKAKAYHDELEYETAEELAAKLKKIVLVIRAKAGKGSKLFGSITAADVVDELSKQYKIELDKRQVDVGGGIKSLGDTLVDVKLHSKISAQLHITVLQV
jgi:large subunit ribosomal protein L9